MMAFQQGNQQTYEYHVVDNFEVRVENRSSGCWSSSSVKLVQLCCIGILLPIIWILLPVYAKLLSYSNSSVPLAFSQVYMLDSKFSTFWCQEHHLHTNSTFNAFLMEQEPTIMLQTETLTRHFMLSDDLKDYWRFYLLKGSKITVRSCARFLGATVTLGKANHTLDLRSCMIDDSSEEEFSKLNNHSNVQIHDALTSNFSNNDRQQITTLRNNSNETISNTNISSSFEGEVDSIENGAFEEDDLKAENIILPTISKRETSMSEESLTSSSEEDLMNCAVVLMTKPVFPDQNCTNEVEYSRHSLVEYDIDEEGYYFIIFSSSFEQEGQENNPVFAKYDLLKSTFNITNAVAFCANTTDCRFSLRFASSERIVLTHPAPYDEELDFNSSFYVESECVPRTPIYLAFGLTLPLVLILCAFL